MATGCVASYGEGTGGTLVFKRRNRRTPGEWVEATLYPKGGWRRAGNYIRHRLQRLPDPPHRIARGIFAGVLISFTPLFGLHFFAAALLAFVMRGNIVAAILATVAGNPVTFPFIAVISVELGHQILGSGDGVPALQILSAFGRAGEELWWNAKAVFTEDPTRWASLERFFKGLWLPYLVGGIIPGLIAGVAAYYISLPILAAYQKLRQKRLRDRAEKLRAAAAARLRGTAAKPTGVVGDDAGRGSR